MVVRRPLRPTMFTSPVGLASAADVPAVSRPSLSSVVSSRITRLTERSPVPRSTVTVVVKGSQDALEKFGEVPKFDV
jgi:hypothetical protein